MHIQHPLRSKGSSQLGRLAKALSPDYFRLDERSAQDLISAAYQYAQMLRYHSPDSPPGDSWACFWEIENLTYMAILAALDTEQIRKDYEKIDYEFGLALENASAKKAKKGSSDIEGQYFRRLLRFTRDTARRLERHYQTLRDDIALKGELLTLIRRDNDKTYDPDDIEGALQQLIAWHKAWDDGLRFETYRAFFQADHRWGIRNLDEYHCILPDESLSDRAQLRALFLQFFNALIAIKSRAQQLFDAEVRRLELPEEQEPRPLAPHIALFITFLNLFRHAQDGLNGIAQRHLDFYYDQVLCLSRRPAEPDHVYLIFTLAKEFNDELVTQGTPLLGGKDKKGQPIRFKTLENWKVTRTQVAEIRNTCIAPDFINASTISEKGAPAAEAFRAFGDDDRNPSGALGFAISSPQLYLLEGQRTVDINLSLEGKIVDANEIPVNLNVEYSTGEGFQKLEKLTISEEGKASGFVLRSLVSPFLPLQTVEPARRIVNDVVSDLCESIGSPSDAVSEIYKRALGAEGNKFLLENIYYPALSGIYSINKIFAEAQQPGAQALDYAFQAELKFYRAYYHWCLANTFLPDYSAAAPTQIPDLSNWNPTSATFSLFGTMKDLYDAIESDLVDATAILGDSTFAPKGKDTTSKTSINYYTVQAFLSRMYLYTHEWGNCKTACDEVLNSGKFSLNGPEYDDSGVNDPYRTGNFKERLRKTFTNVDNAEEVIWALETSQAGLGESLFAYLGYKDSYGRVSRRRYYGESPTLNTFYKESAIEGDAKPTLSGTETQYQTSCDTEWGNHYYDFRDQEYFTFDDPIGIKDGDLSNDKTYSNKYFQNGQTKVPLIRLAEIYLNKAAACMLKNSPTNTDKSTARDCINQIRYRAGALPFLAAANSAKKTTVTLTKPSGLPNLDKNFENYYLVTNADFSKAHVIRERMRELCFEGDRWGFARLANVAMGNRGANPDPAVPGSYSIVLPAPAAIKKELLTSNERNSTLNLHLTLKEDAAPVVPDKKLREKGIARNPIVRVTFAGNENGKPDGGNGSKFYNFLKNQRVTEVEVKVDVVGIRKNIKLQNDFGTFAGTERFFPFGPVPENSARAFLGCEEAFNKKISSATVTFDWVEEEPVANGSKGYDDVYANYDKHGKTKPNPSVRIELLKNATFVTPPVLTKSMFVEVSGKKRMDPRYQFSVLDFERVDFGEEVLKYEPSQKRGFLRATLVGDFGHKNYPFLVTKAAVAQIAADIPGEPYTPAANGISLNYISVQVMQRAFDQFFHVLPFSEGLHEADIFQDEIPISLVYPYDSPAGMPDSGGFLPANLFLGLENHRAGDNLSLLFQTADGSERDHENLPPKIHWMYLLGNEWQAIPVQQILRDTTRGLTRSGILQLAVPHNITSQGNTMLNPELLWLRAAVLETPRNTVGALPSLLSIQAQAVEAVFVPEADSDLERLAEALEAGVVSKLETSSSAIKKVEQPFSSFGGRKPETDASEYYRRVRERLRHKDRAVNAWDYEHLLLEQYGAVATAKCIPHTRYERSGEYIVPSQLAPGFVSVAVIPDLLRRPNMVREQPRFSRGDLSEMRDFLLPKANLFLQPIPPKAGDASDEEDHFLQVLNPQYEPVHIALSVWLKKGADQNLAKYQINEALRRHLSPWLYDPAAGPEFGREIRRSKLLQLVEEIDAVDVVRWLKIFHVVLPKGKDYPKAGNSEGLLVIDQSPLGSNDTQVVAPDSEWEPYEALGLAVRPATARSILTTAAEHQILVIGGIGGDTQRKPDASPVDVPAAPEIPVVAPRKVLAPPTAAKPSASEAKSNTSKRK